VWQRQDANDDNCERSLRFGTDSVRKGHRQKAEHGEQSCHENSAKPQHRAAQNGVVGIGAFVKSCLKQLNMTTPLRTAWPKRAMKPIAAETLKGIPVRSRAKMHRSAQREHSTKLAARA